MTQLGIFPGNAPLMMKRREFVQGMGKLTLGASLLAVCPWFDAFAQQKDTLKEKIRLGIIGPGDRGKYLMRFLAANPKADIVAVCDDYKPNLAGGLTIAPNAKAYSDYRKLLEDKSIDAVVIATPPYLHAQMLLDAFAAGKHAFVEKAFSIDKDETLTMYNAYKKSNRVLYVGHQRMFDPRYIQIMERIHKNEFGPIQCIRMQWDRNSTWRRPLPSKDMERKINWRLYNEYSRGIMTELASHQYQVGNWAMKSIPNKIMGHGAIVTRKDGREVYDDVSTLMAYDNGVMMNFNATCSNRFNGLEEQILCERGTITPEKQKYYLESTPPAPGLLRMINDMEKKAFDAVPFAGTSWAPETAKENDGNYILEKKTKSDGSGMMLEAFVESVITGKKVTDLVEEGYYSSMLCLLGHDAMAEERIITFPDKYKIDYLNHKAPVQS